MLPEFTVVAGGHNFRPEPAARQRHRVKRKFEYLMERFGGESFCVGCGRCGRQCTTHIDIFEIVNDVAKG
jgi:CO dehydrogenase/acetyl-CoA synthase alpha subunit